MLNALGPPCLSTIVRLTSPLMNTSREHRAAEIQDSIRQVLFHDWDPIGVNSSPKLADEYDSYIAPVYRILTGTRSEDDLIVFLFRTEHDQIGTGCQSAEQLRPVARKLLALSVTL
jgi:hypothetical protein